MNRDRIRPGEVAVIIPNRVDAGLLFIGFIRTPYASPEDVPQGLIQTLPNCLVEIDEPWHEALIGLEASHRVELVFWNAAARRNLVRQPRNNVHRSIGTFATRLPDRPNPIGSAIVEVLAVDTHRLTVSGLACPNATPLLDIRPVD